MIKKFNLMTPGREKEETEEKQGSKANSDLVFNTLEAMMVLL
jgi:phosphotransferase system  glucose/maltose/N-acetylglucosamine-specific IIC component